MQHTNLLTLLFVATFFVTPSYGATAQHWSSQAACEMATKAKCTQDDAKTWRAAEGVRQPAAKKQARQPDTAAPPQAAAEQTIAPPPVTMPVPPPAATPPVPAEPVKAEGGFFANLFGGKKAESAPVAKPATISEPDATKPVPPPRSPEPQRAPVDPEAILRGKVWTSEAACKKEALKGKCSSIDCATHSGGACTGYTSMIWIYR